MNNRELTLEVIKSCIQKKQEDQNHLFDRLCFALQIKDEDKYIFRSYCFSNYVSAEESGIIDKYLDKD